MFIGVGVSRVRNIFSQAKKNIPCIIFINEIDAFGHQRRARFADGNDEREQTINQILVEMDGFDGNPGIIMITTTNRVDVLDNILLCPGRFSRKIMEVLETVREVDSEVMALELLVVEEEPEPVVEEPEMVVEVLETVVEVLWTVVEVLGLVVVED